MTVVNTLIPFVSAIISFVFAAFIFKRYMDRRRAHLLLWGLGMVFYGIGGFCEAYFGAFGWNPLIFRLWYLFGAILVAAWLGQGTVYLLGQRLINEHLVGNGRVKVGQHIQEAVVFTLHEWCINGYMTS